MTDLEVLFKQNKIEYCLNEAMSGHTSFKIGGQADIFARPKTEEQLSAILTFINGHKIPYYVVGNGSNLLVSDEGIEGVVISTLKMNKIILISDTEIFAEAGASLTAVCLFAQKNSLSGLEFAYGIPGSVGGALYMNAGAYGGEMSQVVAEASSIDPSLNIVKRTKEQMELGYRESIYRQNGEIITGITFSLKKGDKQKIADEMKLYMSKRKASQPLDFGSAGSTFKRPIGYYAAALIDECGLKGLSVGDAMVSEKHAGFVINKGNASCKDVQRLIEKIQTEVEKKRDVKLETEVIFTGRK